MPDDHRMELPLQTRLQPITSYDAKARTAELVWTTGASVRRYDWWKDREYDEVLVVDPAAVRMGRLQTGAPLLDTHDSWSLRSVIGVVEEASISGGQGSAKVRFSEREEVAGIVRDVEAGILRNVSVGYRIHKIERIPPKNDSERWQYRIVDWEPMEISLVPIGADAGAGVRSEPGGEASAAPRGEQSGQRLYPCLIVNRADDTADRKENTMSGANPAAGQQPAPVPAATPDPEALRNAEEAARAAERARVTLAVDLCTKHRLDAEAQKRLISECDTEDKVRARVLELIAERDAQDKPSGVPYIETVRDAVDVRRAGAAEALLHRYDPTTNKLSDNGRQYRGLTLLELARVCLEASGVRTLGMTRMEIATRSFLSGNDLPNIVADVANKTLRAAYESTPRTFTAFSRMALAADFKNINRMQLSGAPSLEKVSPSGEIKRGFVSDGKEVYALATYAKIVGINRQTIINDDMDAFTRLPALMARAAADLESDTVYGILTSNPNMGDGVALFHTATHKNLSGTSDAISVDSLSAGRAAMRKQVGLEGRPINLTPRFLVVPAAKETTAQQFTAEEIAPALATNANVFRGRLQAIAEPRLDAASATAWYLVADPAQIDTIEYAYLEGQQGAYLETRMGFDIDGMEIKVVDDFAAKALDWRGFWKNPGA